MSIMYNFEYSHPDHPHIQMTRVFEYEYGTNVQTGPAIYSHANPWSNDIMECAIVEKLNLEEVVKWKMIWINRKHC